MGSLTPSQVEQQLEAENAVAALVAEVSRAAVASASQKSVVTDKPKNKHTAKRRMTGFYPAKVGSTGTRKRDELDVGFAFDLSARPSARSTRGQTSSATSHATLEDSRNRTPKTLISMARYVSNVFQRIIHLLYILNPQYSFGKSVLNNISIIYTVFSLTLFNPFL